ncbi:FGGY-family carbohydrate kinase, partial [Lactobacillus sp.]
KVLGHPPVAIRMSGGACNSKQWVQMFADVLNLPIELTAATELGGLGGAIACAVGSGVYPNFLTAVSKMTRVVARYEPREAATKIYEQKYHVYRSLLQALDGNWAGLNDLKRS